jgi:hypothetical protein
LPLRSGFGGMHGGFGGGGMHFGGAPFAGRPVFVNRFNNFNRFNRFDDFAFRHHHRFRNFGFFGEPFFDDYTAAYGNYVAMAEASRIILNGFELRTEAKEVRWPDRYMDLRGADMWGRIMRVLRDIETSEMPVAAE